MQTRLLALLFVAAGGFVAIDVGCASNTASSAQGSTGATSGVTSGSGGHGGKAGSGGATASNAVNASSSATSGAGGQNPCTGSIDTPCKQCAATKCHDQAKACADTSTCAMDGTPTAGCLALVNCAAMKCTKMGMLDQLCVLGNCSSELASAGGPMGKGTANAIALGQCLNSNCMTQCSM